MTRPTIENSGGVVRDARTVTTWNLVSRLTGFGRVIVVGGALGATRLGDTYQAANQVSNLLFEFLAAGTLSAVLVPGLVTRMVGGDRSKAEAFAGALLARALVILGAVAVVGAIAARPIMHAVLSGNDTSSRGAQVRLGAFLLLFVMPQLLLYAWGAVVTAMLNASGHFAAGAAAPVANNLFVMAAVGAFWVREARGLELGHVDRLLLAGGVFGGVLCMTLIPAVMAARLGLSIRPRWTIDERLGGSLRQVGWATLVVVPAQLFLFGAIVVSGRVPGGVMACQVGFTLFLLPHALLGHPLTTVLFPRIARSCASEDHVAAQRDSERGLRVLLVLTAPAAALLVALAPWLVTAISFGALAQGAGPAVVAAVLAGYGFGLSAYSWSLFVTRIAYATSDVRTPGLAAVAGGVVGGAVLLFALSAEGTALLFRVGLAHSAMVTATVALIFVSLWRRQVVALSVRDTLVTILAAGAGGLAGRLVADLLHAGSGRVASLSVAAAAGAVGLVVYVAGLWVAGLRWAALRAQMS
jgi:putative peptidoglycan lipid II flippase